MIVTSANAELPEVPAVPVVILTVFPGVDVVGFEYVSEVEVDVVSPITNSIKELALPAPPTVSLDIVVGNDPVVASMSNPAEDKLLSEMSNLYVFPWTRVNVGFATVSI